jgi:sigma-E factor negative regulatory protein RseC
MTSSGNYGMIEHEGIVKKSDSNSVTVLISSVSACTGCHAEGYCSLSGKEDKIIDIKGNYRFNTGDQVIIQMKKTMGHKAVLLGYILPLVLIVFTLILLISLSAPEGLAGLLSLVMLIPYYLILRIFRKRINNVFSFTIKI